MFITIHLYCIKGLLCSWSCVNVARQLVPTLLILVLASSSTLPTNCLLSTCHSLSKTCYLLHLALTFWMSYCLILCGPIRFLVSGSSPLFSDASCLTCLHVVINLRPDLSHLPQFFSFIQLLYQVQNTTSQIKSCWTFKQNFLSYSFCLLAFDHNPSLAVLTRASHPAIPYWPRAIYKYSETTFFLS